MSDTTISSELEPALRRAARLARWQIFWTVTIVIVMGSVLGSSQTMKTAWIEDMLGFIPPIAFLIALWLERKGRSRRFPFGFQRAGGLGFLVSAVALAAMGVLLLVDAIATLTAREHASVGSAMLFGREIWLGWLMMGAQGYAILPPLIIGRMMLPLARELNDKQLHTDALMNKANWMTGAAGIAGIVGLGLGWWWADALAAGIISLDIINDGVGALRAATAELTDGTPRALEGNAVADDAAALQAALETRFPGADVRLRETGRVIRAEIHGARPPDPTPPVATYWPGDPDRAWRLAQVTFTTSDG